MDKYIHHVQYYETDKMGIVHHSNYIRWLEEARVHAMDKMGYSFSKLENNEMYSPVLSYSIEIKHSCTFDDLVEIETKVKSYDSIKLEMQYTIRKEDKTIAIATTKHCFTNKSGLPLRLNKAVPELDKKFKEELENNK